MRKSFADITKKKEADPDKIIAPDLNGRGILIVEDDPIERKLAEEAMLKMGYKPFVVDNFAKASSVLQNGNFLFVLTDLHYPCCSDNNATAPEQKQPQPNGLTLALDIKINGGKVAILTDQYHHGSVEWASNLCSSLRIPFLDTENEWDTLENERGKKKWRKAIEILKERPSVTLRLVEDE